MNLIPLFSSDLFLWKGNRGTAERSGMPKEPTMIVKPDHSEAYFAVISAKTNSILAFYPIHDEDGYDGEFQRYTDLYKRFVITIYND